MPRTLDFNNLSTQQRQFVSSFATEGNSIRAAAAAGYKHPATQGPRILRRLRPVIDSYLARKELEKTMPPHEALELLAAIARGSEPKHREQLKAIELVLRSHGVLSDKLQVTLDRRALLSQVTEYIRKLRAVDVESRLLPADANPPAPESQGNSPDVESCESPLDSATYRNSSDSTSKAMSSGESK